ncbi:UNVERIFIED_CONTAM: hypothetical protein GTU68_030268 [Idotea baltica]|nr:hypothetical protein [Idotea baltica]
MNLPPQVTPRAFARLSEIGAAIDGKALRVAVEGGGCSGFQYEIALDEARDDDLVLEGSGETVVVDSVSLPFLANAVYRLFHRRMIGARFVDRKPECNIIVRLLRHVLLDCNGSFSLACPEAAHLGE